MPRRPILLTRAVVALALLGSAPAGAQGPPDAPRLSAEWSVKVSDPAGARFLAAAADRVVALTWQGDVLALDSASGKRVWRQQPKQRGGVDAPALAVDGERVVVTWPGESRVVAYGLRDGRQAWEARLSAPAVGLADCARHRAVVVTHRGMGTLLATALDPKSGARLWQAPVDGPLVGAGDAYVFTATPSGFGVWPGAIGAVHCATGERRTLPTNDRKLVRFLAAGDGFAATRNLDPGFAREQLCLHPLGEGIADGASSVCADTGDGEAPAHPLAGALIDGGVVYSSTAHIAARNLDPSADGWIFARGLDGRVRWRSPPSVSHGAPVAAGELLWAGFGGTGAEDFAYLVDRADGRPVGRLPLGKAPTALAVDRERAYVATYDGRVAAVRLPRPGPAPVERKPVVPRSEEAVAAPVDRGPWRLLKVLDAHPKTAKTSGSRRAGTASPVAFVDPEGALLAVGGNDDKVRVFDVKSGKRRWISKSLGKDVEALQAGGERLHARVYGGRSFTFTRQGSSWRRQADIRHAQGWMSGITGDGASVITDAFDGAITAYDAVSGLRRWQRPTRAGFDQRGVRVVGQRLVVHDGAELVVYDLGASSMARIAGRPMPRAIAEGAMTQARMVDEARGVWEYCGPAQCVVELGRLVGAEATAAPTRRIFDTRGAGWVPDVPSTLEVSADGRWLFFFRLGLEPLLVDVASDARIPLSAVTGRPAGDYTTAAFSADGRRLALGMHPASWQVTVIEKE